MEHKHQTNEIELEPVMLDARQGKASKILTRVRIWIASDRHRIQARKWVRLISIAKDTIKEVCHTIRMVEQTIDNKHQAISLLDFDELDKAKNVGMKAELQMHKVEELY
ncbi:hypothetical protein MJO28_017918 [Puccinia striiformis f. sp. tritici]|nr:hypothetical protein MJO28_017918 [Puccinia striiformis f. sp. tritici]